jgi:hypothetical protein
MGEKTNDILSVTHNQLIIKTNHSIAHLDINIIPTYTVTQIKRKSYITGKKTFKKNVK